MCIVYYIMKYNKNVIDIKKVAIRLAKFVEKL